jgi:hypothetical protein
MPDPDLMIRTSGEYRISNFLLWELAYSELVFTDVLWPDFRREHLFAAMPSTRPGTAASVASTAGDRGGGRLMAPYRDTAVVLRTWKLGEADRILALYTRDHGKVRAVAKGVRKSRSRFGSRVEPGRHVTVQLYKGRGELDTVTQVELLDAWASLRESLDRFARASAMLETERSRHPGPSAGAGRSTSSSSARCGSSPSGDAPLVVAGFVLGLLALEGVAARGRPLCGVRLAGAAGGARPDSWRDDVSELSAGRAGVGAGSPLPGPRGGGTGP